MQHTMDLIVDGLRTVVYDNDNLRQSPREEAVVFVHGNPGSIEDWEALLPEIGTFARVVAMDLPGFGRSEHPSRFNFSVRGYSEFLEKLLLARGITRAHLVLHDFGGPFGLAWAALHPTALGSMTLIDTGILKGYRWHTMAKLWRTPIVGELVQLLSQDATIQWALQRQNPLPLPHAVTARIARYMDWHHKLAVLQLYRNAQPVDEQVDAVVDTLRERNPPACVIWGAQDPFLPAKLAHQQVEALPRAEVHVLDGLGHWPFIDDPQTVQRILTPFLKNAVGRSEPA